MSNPILTTAWSTRGLSPTEKLILVRLADRADNAGKCFPGHKSLADDCCLSERTVRDTLPRIETQGHITIAEEAQRTNPGKARFTYTVHPVTPELSSSATPENGATDTGKRRAPQRKSAVPTPENDDSCILTNSTQNNHKRTIKIINPRLTNLKINVSSIQRIAREIASNKRGWSYDNCKIKPAEIVSASLETILRPFIGKLSATTVHQCWQEAVTRAHGATVDGSAKRPAAYCVECFRERLQAAVK